MIYNKGREGEGTYIHMFNSLPSLDIDAICDYIQNFSGIDGEICAALPGDRQFSTHAKRFGVMISGIPTKVWDADVWSYLGEDGKRYAHPDPDMTSYGRSEAWIIPKDSRVTAIITDGINPDDVGRISMRLRLDAIPFSAIHNHDYSHVCSVCGRDVEWNDVVIDKKGEPVCPDCAEYREEEDV